MSPLLLVFIKSAAMPAIAAGVALFVVGALKDPRRRLFQGLILALSFMAGAYVLISRLGFPPSDVSESLSYAALLLAAFVVIAPRDASSRYGIRAVFTLLCGVVLLWHIRASLMSQVHLRNLLAFFCLGLGVWSIVERGERLVQPATLILLPLISATATSLLLLFAASASLSQMLSILCALLGAVLILAFLTPARLSTAALIPFVSIFPVLFMTAGHFYLDVNPWHMVYMCLPFLVLWIRGWIPIPRQALVEGLILGLLSALPLGYFVWTVFKSSGPLY